jgi:hypothetical protein
MRISCEGSGSLYIAWSLDIASSGWPTLSPLIPDVFDSSVFPQTLFSFSFRHILPWISLSFCDTHFHCSFLSSPNVMPLILRMAKLQGCRLNTNRSVMHNVQDPSLKSWSFLVILLHQHRRITV